ncbi:hypothetical protein CRUP_028748 [Coryphaenoides rupestris]|nr:hypothetical protein CRUP_028748 [Coryphaenoides rupestris]
MSNITAVSFSLEAHAANRSVVLHITDPLTGIYQGQRLLTIREVFQKDLKYKISYLKVGSTRKKEVECDSNMAMVGDLEPQQSYCFSVAAFIPSRDRRSQLGAWSQQQCLPANKSLLQELRVEVLAAGSLIILLKAIGVKHIFAGYPGGGEVKPIAVKVELRGGGFRVKCQIRIIEFWAKIFLIIRIQKAVSRMFRTQFEAIWVKGGVGGRRWLWFHLKAVVHFRRKVLCFLRGSDLTGHGLLCDDKLSHVGR